MGRVKAVAMIVFGLCFALGLAPAMMLGGRQQVEQAAVLRREGRQAKARIDAVIPVGALRLVTYSFSVNGRKVSASTSASLTEAEKYQSAGVLNVTYLPSDPRVATLDLSEMERDGKAENTNHPIFWALIGLLFVGYGTYHLRK